MACSFQYWKHDGSSNGLLRQTLENSTHFQVITSVLWYSRRHFCICHPDPSVCKWAPWAFFFWWALTSLNSWNWREMHERERKISHLTSKQWSCSSWPQSTIVCSSESILCKRSFAPEWCLHSLYWRLCILMVFCKDKITKYTQSNTYQLHSLTCKKREFFLLRLLEKVESKKYLLFANEMTAETY